METKMAAVTFDWLKYFKMDILEIYSFTKQYMDHSFMVLQGIFFADL